MITNEESKSLILSFLSGTDPFSEVRQLLGQASSGAPDVFLKWFSQQPSDDQATVGKALVDLVLFEEGLGRDVSKAMALLAALAGEWPATLSPNVIQTLEQFILRGDKVSVWVNDEESEDDDQKDVRSQWRYALGLWNVLSSVGSSVVNNVFDTLVQRARDPEFVRAITLAKRVRERPPFGF